MNFNIRRHLPLTTNRIEFRFASSAGPLPTITPRIDFAGDCPKGDNLVIDDLESGRGHTTKPVKPPEPQGVTVPTPVPEELTSELSEIDSSEPGDDLESEEEDFHRERSSKIPKPRGEPGRPGSGGYNIESVLTGWTAELILDVKNFVKNHAGNILDETKSYGKQKPARLAQLCVLAKQRFPIIDKYENYWPVRDILKLHLKSTSRNHRKQF